MQIRGKIWKDQKYWIIECSTLNASTQGKTKKDALCMMADWVRTMLNDQAFPIAITAVGGTEFKMSFSQPTPIVALILSRTRSSSKATLSEIAKAMGSDHPNSVYQYESGKHDPSVQKLNDLLRAMGCELVLSVVKDEDSEKAA